MIILRREKGESRKIHAILHMRRASVEFCTCAASHPDVHFRYAKVATQHCVVAWKGCWCRNCVRYRGIVTYVLQWERPCDILQRGKQKQAGNYELWPMKLTWAEFSGIELRVLHRAHAFAPSGQSCWTILPGNVEVSMPVLSMPVLNPASPTSLVRLNIGQEWIVRMVNAMHER